MCPGAYRRALALLLSSLPSVQVEQLDLNHRKLRRLHNLTKMVNLRRASFADNELSKIEGLDKCALMEELCLEENRILKVTSSLLFSSLLFSSD